jgi:hypothetical protein
MAARVSFQTVFLREFARTYVSQISFTTEALEDLKRCRFGLADVLYVLKKGRVTMSDKEDAEGANWAVQGNTSHGDSMSVSLHVWCDHYQVRVLRVFNAKGVSDV